MRALDLKTGKQVWNFETEGQVDASPVVVGGRVYVGCLSDGGEFYVLDLKTGKELRMRLNAEGPAPAPAPTGATTDRLKALAGVYQPYPFESTVAGGLKASGTPSARARAAVAAPT